MGASLLLSEEAKNNLFCSSEVGTLISVAVSLTTAGAGETLGALVVSAATEVKNRPSVVSRASLDVDGAGDTVGAFVMAITSLNFETAKRSKKIMFFMMQ